MSKVDALRAMREARYAENTARAESAPPVMAAKATAAPRATAARRAPTRPPIDETVEPALCGHRNMGGRTCTRDQDHAEKSHRYS